MAFDALRSNPIARRLIARQNRHLPLWVWAVIAGVLFTGSMLMVILIPVLRAQILGVFLFVGIVTAWLFLIVVTGGTARQAAYLAVQDVDSEEFELFRLTTVSGEARIWGYALAALHANRTAVAICAGLLPLVVLGTPAATTFFDTLLNSSVFQQGIGEVLLRAARTTAVTITFLGLTFHGALFGTGIGLWLGRRWLAGFISSGTMFLLSSLVLLAVYALTNLPVPSLLIAVVLALAAFALLPVTVRWAQRYAV